MESATQLRDAVGGVADARRALASRSLRDLAGLDELREAARDLDRALRAALDDLNAEENGDDCGDHDRAYDEAVSE